LNIIRKAASSITRFLSPARWSFRLPTVRPAAAASSFLALALGSTPLLAQNIATIAGTGTAGTSAEGVAANTAMVRFPSGSVVDTAGNIYYADTANHRVRVIAVGTSLVTTVAGSGSMGFAGDGGPASSARLAFPSAVALDSAGNLFIADTGNSRIRKVNKSDGNISTIAGDGTPDFGGDAGLATSAKLYYPTGVAVDALNNVYIADTFNHRIRAIAAGTGVISTVAGTGTAGLAGEGSSALSAQLNSPMSLAFNAGTLYVADTLNHKVRSIGGGLIATVAGTGVLGTSGDGGAAISARLNSPAAVTFDAFGNLYVADYGNSRVRAVPATGGIISAFAGTGTAGFAGDAGLASAANLNQPRGVASDLVGGGIVIADSTNQRIRRAGGPGSVTLNVIKAGSGGGTVVGTINSASTGLSCGGSCLGTFPTGATVRLTATPDGISTFSGWSGAGATACTGTATTCDVTLSVATSVTATFAGPPVNVRLINISTRAYVQLGDNVTIAGFAIGGTAPKKVLILARGPSLTAAGLTGVLSDPKLTLVNQTTGSVMTTNDDWNVNNPNAAEIQSLGKAPTDSREAAILATLNPGNYTAIMEGSGARTGIAIVEVYEVDAPTSPLVNISTRGRVETGNNVMIAGFVISGTTQQQVLILARGPSLSAAGVPNVLSDPQVTLVNQATGLIVASNDNWSSQANAAAISATGKAPTIASEAALLVTLDPGAYTAVVSGVGSSSGVAIVEVFAQ
jgi:hypothetical protein